VGRAAADAEAAAGGASADGTPRAPLPLRETLKRLADLARPEAKLMLCAALCMLAGAAAELAVPHFTSRALFLAASGAPRPDFIEAVRSLALAASVYVSFAAVRGALFSVLQNRLSRALRTRLFAVLARQETAFFDGTDSGALTSRLTSDCYAISRCISTNVNVALRNALQAVGGAVILARLSPQLSLAVAGCLVLLWAATVAYGAYSRYSQRVAQDLLAASNAAADETFKSARLVRTFGTERVEQRRYARWLDALYGVGMRQAAAWGLYVVTGTGSNLLARVVALLLGGAAVYQGLLTPQGLTTYMFYVEFVASASLAVCEQYGSIMEAVGASERVVSALADRPCAQVGGGLRPRERLSGHFELRNVWFRYPGRPDAPALQGVSLELERGQLTALVGLSGSGKSTLVGLLQRLYDPTAGSVLADGRDVRELDSAWFRAQISVVSQSAPLLSMTVADNIAYGCGCDFAGPGAAAVGGGGGGQQEATETEDQQQDGSNGTARGRTRSRRSSSRGRSGSRSRSRSRSRSGGGIDLLAAGGGAAAKAPAAHNSYAALLDEEDAAVALEQEEGEEEEREQAPRAADNAAADENNSLHLLPRPTRAEIVEAARAANCHDFIVALPQGYDTPVTDKLLSGGQRARIALARALVRRRATRLLVLDEATASLDAQSEQLVQQALDRVMRERKDMAVLVIAHRLDTVRQASRIYVLDQGEVAEMGTHAQLLQHRGIYWGLVERQSKGLAPGDRDLSPMLPQSEGAAASPAGAVPPMMSSFDADAAGAAAELAAEGAGRADG
jgi:ABC-type multidrug transport system fused ATPase/permease subunit